MTCTGVRTGHDRRPHPVIEQAVGGDVPERDVLEGR